MGAKLEQFLYGAKSVGSVKAGRKFPKELRALGARAAGGASWQAVAAEFRRGHVDGAALVRAPRGEVGNVRASVGGRGSSARCVHRDGRCAPDRGSRLRGDRQDGAGAVVIGSTRRVAVHAYGEPVEMREAFATLSALVRDGMKRELVSGELFLLVSRDRTRAKLRFWDGTEVCLFAKRLERGRFAAACRRDHADPAVRKADRDSAGGIKDPEALRATAKILDREN